MHNDDDVAFFFTHGPDCSCGPVSAEDRHRGADRELPDPMDVECEALPDVEHSDDWWAEAMALAALSI